MKKLSDLSLADLIALYRWYESRYSSDSGKEIMEKFRRVGDEIRYRIENIDYTK